MAITVKDAGLGETSEPRFCCITISIATEHCVINWPRVPASLRAALGLPAVSKQSKIQARRHQCINSRAVYLRNLTPTRVALRQTTRQACGSSSKRSRKTSGIGSLTSKQAPPTERLWTTQSMNGPLCQSTHPVKATGYAVLDSGLFDYAASAAMFCRRQFQGRSSWMRLAG